VTEPSKQSGSDPVGDLQRWLIRSGARSVTRQVGGQIRTALGGGRKQSAANVWETATTEQDDSPECAWCPHCRARRLMRESGPGMGAGVAAAADAVGTVMQDAMSAFEAAVAAAGRPARPRDATTQSRDAAPQPAGEVWDEATDEPAVRTRPPANGSATRQAGPRKPSAEPEQPSAGSKQPSAEAKQPSAEAKQSPAGSTQASGQAKRTPASAKKPAAGTKKPAARHGGSATDRTPPDGPTTAKPDEPTAEKPDDPTD
jgi:hypothetical protein